MGKISNCVFRLFFDIMVWSGGDTFRWKMKKVGWSGWSVSGVGKEPKPEPGYEKEE